MTDWSPGSSARVGRPLEERIDAEDVPCKLGRQARGVIPSGDRERPQAIGGDRIDRRQSPHEIPDGSATAAEAALLADGSTRRWLNRLRLSGTVTA